MGVPPTPVPATNPTPSPKTQKPTKKPKKPKEKPKSKKKPKRPRNIPCPTGGKCLKKFAILSAVANHLESGRCRSGMTRAKLNRLIITHDKNRYITLEVATSAATWEPLSTDPLGLPGEVLAATPLEDAEANAIPPPAGYEDSLSELSDMNGVPLLTPSTSGTDVGSEWSDINGVPLLTPGASGTDIDSEWSLISGVHTPVSTTANFPLRATSAPNPSLRCHICPTTPKARTFHSAQALQAHISSLAHAPKIFHCPFTFPTAGNDRNCSGSLTTQRKEKKKAFKYFKSLGGLAMHMESGACKGGVEVFREATGYVEEEMRKMGFVGIKLLG
ncbi:MAG: hypothetical protein M1840_005560 [Geoglossum simile]|nr:MAG: hypothetical protein M1840_005560 [Geoglossum simile]